MKDKRTKTVVLTGSTGAFGRFLALEFLKHDDVKLILPVRGGSHEEARHRVREILGTESDNTEVFQADLTKEHLGLSKLEYDEITKRTTHVLHSAASTRFTLPLEEARLHNVKTTEQIMDFAKACPGLVRFGFVSTAYVAGRRVGVVKEDEFEHNTGFNNSYQQTKYEAEALVRASAGKLPIVVFRPPFIVTPSLPSRHKGPANFLTVLISLVAQERLPHVPGTEESTMDIVDGFDAARTIVELLLKEDLSHASYHITNGDKAFTIRTLHKMIEEKRGKHIPMEYHGDAISFLRHIEQVSVNKPEMQVVYKRAESFLMEPAYPKVFDNAHTLSELNVKELGNDPVDTIRLMFSDISWNSLE